MRTLRQRRCPRLLSVLPSFFLSPAGESTSKEEKESREEENQEPKENQERNGARENRYTARFLNDD